MLNLTSLPTPDPSKLVSAAGRRLEQHLTSALENNSQVLLLLSGGSNIALAQHLPPELVSHQAVTCLPLDERFSADPELNNSLQLQAAGLPITPTVPSDDETLEMFADRYRQIIDTWLRQYAQQDQGGRVVATIGVGADGHVAGISPFPDQPDRFHLLFDKQTSVIGYEGNLNPAQRVTVTPHFLSHYLSAGEGLVTGDNKLEMLKRLKHQTEPGHVMPAVLLHQLSAEVQLVTDQPLTDIPG